MTYFSTFILAALVAAPLVSAAATSAPKALQPGAPIPASCQKPVYPPEAVKREQEGEVILELYLNVDGTVKDSRVASTSMFPRLDSATLESLRKCRFQPPLEAGKPVAGWTRVAYVWTLQDRPGEPRPKPFDKAPEHLRKFFAGAKKADAIIDPLKRCLSFPDLPGSQWKREEVTALCKAAADVPVSLKVVADHLTRGDLKGLEALYQRDLARHFAAGDHSELIHDDIGAFEIGAEADRLSSAWLEQAPRSPYALAARGRYLVRASHEARGKGNRGETSKEQWRQMGILVNEGLGLLRRSVHIEPRMLPALSSMMWGASLSSEDGIMQEAVDLADKADPACQRVAAQRLKTLQPRWGGSQGEMLAYTAALLPLGSQRPLLMPLMHKPAQDVARGMTDEKNYDDGIKVLRPVVNVSPAPSALEELADAMARKSADQWETLAVSLSAYRFMPGDEYSTLVRGRLLAQVKESAWAVPSLEAALSHSPNDAMVTSWLGMALIDTREWERAIGFLEQSRLDPKHERFALNHLVDLRRQMGQLKEADEVSLAFVTKYGDDPFGWLDRGWVLEYAGRTKEADAAFAKFKSFDGKDRDLKKAITFLEARVKEIRAFKARR